MSFGKGLIFRGYCVMRPFTLTVLPRTKYSITCIQRPLNGSNESGLLQQVIFKCRFYKVDLRRVDVSEQWSLRAGGLLEQVVSNTSSTVHHT